MIESVWDADQDAADVLQAEMLGLLRAGESQADSSQLHRVILFIGAERIEEQPWREKLVSLGRFIAAHGIKPCFIVRRQPLGPRARRSVRPAAPAHGRECRRPGGRAGR